MTMTIDGTAGATFPNASVQAKSAQGPCFSAYQSVAQSIPQTTLTKIQFQTKEFDLTSAFDATTNYRFQPLVAGYYQVNGVFSVTTPASSLSASIYKNGIRFKDGSKGVVTAAYLQASSVAAVIYLNGSTDYVELYGYHSNGAAISADATALSTYFQAALIRAA